MVDWNWLVAILVGVGIGFLITNTVDGIRFLKRWADANPKYHFAIDSTIEVACTIAEKIFKSGEGQEKLKFAVSWVLGQAEHYGLKLDEQVVIDAVNRYVAEVINAGREEVKE